MAMASLVWSVSMSAGVWIQQARVQDTREHLNDAKLAYDDLLQEIEGYQRKVVAITGKLKRGQSDLLSKLASEGDLDEEGVSQSQHRVAITASELSDKKSRDAMHAHLRQLNAELAEIDSLNTLLDGSVQSVQADLASVEAERAEVYEARTLLKRRVGQLEQALALDAQAFQSDLGRLATENKRHVSKIALVAAEAETTKAQYNRLIAVRDELQGEIARLNGSMQAATQRGDGLAENLRFLLAGLSDAVGGDGSEVPRGEKGRAEYLLSRLNGLHDAQSDIIETLKLRTAGGIADAEAIVAMTGLKVSKVLASAALQARRDADSGAPELDGAILDGAILDDSGLGRGGPFVAVTSDARLADSFVSTLEGLDDRIQRSEKLRRVLASMPLIPPVDNYSIASPYGRRTDPFTKKHALHSGVDLAGRRSSAVRATAPGKVVFAGWKGNYGRFIEIDHGNGFKSRYGHLQKTLVKKGQQVGHRAKIGLLGSTGRSTGPHVHYEVWFEKRSLNPMKFIKAGRYVFKK
ncbi:MAG: murein DD-endopeptidase MepM/ murein hydrolase activator NlpD [Alphaproteobacteria bacterium]|jgi:murein DD-endopeptidase MepM/ murein hydrolase activator NlpD